MVSLSTCAIAILLVTANSLKRSGVDTSARHLTKGTKQLDLRQGELAADPRKMCVPMADEENVHNRWFTDSRDVDIEMEGLDCGLSDGSLFWEKAERANFCPCRLTTPSISSYNTSLAGDENASSLTDSAEQTRLFNALNASAKTAKMEACEIMRSEKSALEMIIREAEEDAHNLEEMRNNCNISGDLFWENAVKMGCMKTENVSLDTFCYGLLAHCPAVMEMFAIFDESHKEFRPRIEYLTQRVATCPIDGVFTEWSICKTWFGAGGPGNAYRNCTNPEPRNGGKACEGVVEMSCFVEDCDSTGGEVKNDQYCACGASTCDVDTFCASSANLCFANALSKCPSLDGKTVNRSPCYCGSKICAKDYYCTSVRGGASQCDPEFGKKYKKSPVAWVRR